MFLQLIIFPKSESNASHTSFTINFFFKQHFYEVKNNTIAYIAYINLCKEQVPILWLVGMFDMWQNKMTDAENISGLIQNSFVVDVWIRC